MDSAGKIRLSGGHPRLYFRRGHSEKQPSSFADINPCRGAWGQGDRPSCMLAVQKDWQKMQSPGALHDHMLLSRTDEADEVYIVLERTRKTRDCHEASYCARL